MSQDTVLTIVRSALMTTILTSAPPLLMSLIVGLIISIFQTITSINEQNLVFVPKILAVFISLIIFGAFMMSNMQDLFYNLYGNLVDYIK